MEENGEELDITLLETEQQLLMQQDKLVETSFQKSLKKLNENTDYAERNTYQFITEDKRTLRILDYHFLPVKQYQEGENKYNNLVVAFCEDNYLSIQTIEGTHLQTVQLSHGLLQLTTPTTPETFMFGVLADDGVHMTTFTYALIDSKTKLLKHLKDSRPQQKLSKEEQVQQNDQDLAASRQFKGI